MIAVHTSDALADASLTEHLVDIYRSAFTVAPWNESDAQVQEFRGRLRAAGERPGFRLVVAQDAGEAVGFATAWITLEPFPSDRAYGRVAAALGPSVVAERLSGSLEVDELAVRPTQQGKGIASRLLATLTGDGQHAAWLLTSPDAVGAVEFYRRIGWNELTAETTDHRIHVFATPR